MSLLLSIDVGIKNLAICLMSQEDYRIVKWDVSGVPPQHADGLFVCMRDHLRDKPWVLDADTVVIEKQPDKNKGMVSVQHFLHAYFIIHDKKTIIYDARHKVPDVVGSGKRMYAKRKKVSIERVHEHLKTEEINADWLSLFESSKKKDDLADTFLQGKSYIDRKVVEPPKEKKLSPRKPTTNQRENKYSKSNLLWLMKEMGMEEFKKSKRIMKDTKRYFKSPEEVRSYLTAGGFL
tara:strand:+ start:2795 stop:3499 length:705 start_codon:yes stop_codon:yes gene_type:complete